MDKTKEILERYPEAIQTLKKRLPRIEEIISGSINAMKTEILSYKVCQDYIKTYNLTLEEVFALTI